jgi:O-acetyl-ADP-ribose deacetylase (regulator of RNase III)
MMQIVINDTAISVRKGDITTWSGDIIVNASNSGLYGGGGVDGAIHRAGGPQIAEECAVIRQKQGGCLPGEVAITSGGNLPVRFIIHTVGPIWKGGSAGEKTVLARCYRSSLDLASARNANSIAFPNISTGVYNFPKELASRIALDTVTAYVKEHSSSGLPLKAIDFICFESENVEIYEEVLTNYGNSE